MRRLAFFVTAALATVTAAPRTSLAAPRGGSERSPVVAAPTAPAVRVVEVTSARIHLHDLMLLPATMPDVDLGPTPPLGSTRTVDREQIVQALAAAKAPANPLQLPAQMRVVRKSRKLTPAEIDHLVRAAVEPSRLPKGAIIATVRGSLLEVPDGFDHVVVDLPVTPRRSGSVTVTAAVSFVVDTDVVARTTLPIELSVPPEALIPDVAKGAAITLIVRHGLVEVSAPAVAAADGDTGSVLLVLLKPSGRVIRARILDKDHAVAIEES